MPNNANIDDRNVSLGNFGINPIPTVVTAAKTLGNNETNVLATAAAGNYTITPPPAAENLNGMIRVVLLSTGGGEVTFNSAVATAAEDMVIAFSDGRKWINIYTSVTE